MKKVIVFLLAYLSVASLCAQGDLHIYTVENKAGKITPMMIQKAFVQNGFEIGINSDIHSELTKRFGKSGFKVYNAMSMYHGSIGLRLLKEQADAGVFVPMGVAIYQKSGEDNLHISVVTAATQTKILGKETRLLAENEFRIKATIEQLFPKAKHSYSKKALKESRPLLTKFEKNVKGLDVDDAREELEEGFEEAFAEAGFVMPSYFDFTDEIKDSPYDFYVTYSICKLEVIVPISKVAPEAAAFAPCTTMLYKKSDEDKIVMGFTSVYNWLSSVNISDKNSKKALTQAQRSFEAVLKGVTK